MGECVGACYSLFPSALGLGVCLVLGLVTVPLLAYTYRRSNLARKVRGMLSLLNHLCQALSHRGRLQNSPLLEAHQDTSLHSCDALTSSRRTASKRSRSLPSIAGTDRPTADQGVSRRIHRNALVHYDDIHEPALHFNKLSSDSSHDKSDDHFEPLNFAAKTVKNKKKLRAHPKNRVYDTLKVTDSGPDKADNNFEPLDFAAKTVKNNKKLCARPKNRVYDTLKVTDSGPDKADDNFEPLDFVVKTVKKKKKLRVHPKNPAYDTLTGIKTQETFGDVVARPEEGTQPPTAYPPPLSPYPADHLPNERPEDFPNDSPEEPLVDKTYYQSTKRRRLVTQRAEPEISDDV